jgi:hypothetical protein
MRSCVGMVGTGGRDELCNIQVSRFRNDANGTEVENRRVDESVAAETKSVKHNGESLCLFLWEEGAAGRQ